MSVLVAPHRPQLIPLYNQVAIVAPAFLRIMLPSVIHVPFGMDENLLASFLILKADVIVVCRTPFFRTAGHESASRAVIRKLIGWHGLRIVNATGDNGPVRVAFEKFHNHFLANPRNPHGSPILARPRL